MHGISHSMTRCTHSQLSLEEAQGPLLRRPGRGRSPCPCTSYRLSVREGDDVGMASPTVWP